MSRSFYIKLMDKNICMHTALKCIFLHGDFTSLFSLHIALEVFYTIFLYTGIDATLQTHTTTQSSKYETNKIQTKKRRNKFLNNMAYSKKHTIVFQDILHCKKKRSEESYEFHNDTKDYTIRIENCEAEGAFEWNGKRLEETFSVKWEQRNKYAWGIGKNEIGKFSIQLFRKNQSTWFLFKTYFEKKSLKRKREVSKSDYWKEYQWNEHKKALLTSGKRRKQQTKTFTLDFGADGAWRGESCKTS